MSNQPVKESLRTLAEAIVSVDRYEDDPGFPGRCPAISVFVRGSLKSLGIDRDIPREPTFDSLKLDARHAAECVRLLLELLPATISDAVAETIVKEAGSLTAECGDLKARLEKRRLAKMGRWNEGPEIPARFYLK